MTRLCRFGVEVSFLLWAAVIWLAAAALAPNPGICAPTSPEDNLVVIRVQHRDAGEVAGLGEEILRRTTQPGEMDPGIITVDPGLNAIVVRAAGPGATWPASLERIVNELDQPTEAGRIRVSLWRTGWAERRPRTPDEQAEAEAVLAGEPGERLDVFEAPVETGTFFSAWLESAGKPPVRTVGVVGPSPDKGKGIRLLPVRVEVVMPGMGTGPEPPGGLEGTGTEMREGAGRGETGGPAASRAGKPGEPGATGERGVKGRPVEEAMEKPPGETPKPKAGSADEDAGQAGKTEAGPLLPPPYGEVVFAGPVTVRAGRPAVIGPFSVPGLEGRLVVAMQAVEE